VKVFVDSDVLIWHLRGEKKATALLKTLRDTPGCELWTGALQRAEVLFYTRPAENDVTRAFLALFRTAPVTDTVVDSAAVMFRQWHPSHGIDVADALLAATASRAGGKIVTRNIKHFPMPEVAAEKAW